MQIQLKGMHQQVDISVKFDLCYALCMSPFAI